MSVTSSKRLMRQGMLVSSDADVAEGREALALDALEEIAAVDEFSPQRARRSPPSVRSEWR